MANKKISTLTNSLTKSTVATNDLTVIADTSASESKKMTYGELMSPTDANFRIAGSSDNTKLVAFEVDGLTTATTRTLTVPDADMTLVGTDTTQTLTNKTLTSPQVNFGSDANGDISYRNGSGVTARLPIGSTDQILAVQAGLPVWIANPSATAASYATAGIATIDADVRYYAADAGANDTYVITLSPAPSAYTTGMKISFKANTVNTGAATINVNSLGAKTIVKGVNTTLADGDIAAGMLCTIIYDGTNFVLQNPVSTAITPAFSGLFKTGLDTHTSSSTTTKTIAHGLGITPKFIRITVGTNGGNTIGEAATYSTGTYNGTVQKCVYRGYDGNGANYDSGADSNFIIRYAYIASGSGSPSSNMIQGSASWDSTNITLTWTKTGSPVEQMDILWEAYA